MARITKEHGGKIIRGRYENGNEAEERVIAVDGEHYFYERLWDKSFNNKAVGPVNIFDSIEIVRQRKKFGIGGFRGKISNIVFYELFETESEFYEYIKSCGGEKIAWYPDVIEVEEK